MPYTLVRLLTVVTIMSVAACAEQAERLDLGARPTQEQPPAPTVSQFQSMLDQHAVDFTVPPVGKAILVNIPAFELIAFEDGEPVLRSRTIVGTPWNQTPVMETYASVVRFRPTWRPTPSMVASGEYVDQRVPAGPNNPLGLAAIRLEPGLLIYLHDTNRRHLFGETGRARSHGCVRVEQWDALIAWLLDEEPTTIHAWAEGRRTFDEPAPPVPVILGYYTSFPDEEGRLVEHVDIYERRTEPAPIRASSVISEDIAG